MDMRAVRDWPPRTAAGDRNPNDGHSLSLWRRIFQRPAELRDAFGQLAVHAGAADRWEPERSDFQRRAARRFSTAKQRFGIGAGSLLRHLFEHRYGKLQQRIDSSNGNYQPLEHNTHRSSRDADLHSLRNIEFRWLDHDGHLYVDGGHSARRFGLRIC